MAKHCCKTMDFFVFEDNKTMEEAALEDKLICFRANIQEYGIPCIGCSDSYYRLSYCPWCGKKLPKSRRIKFLKILRKKGFEPFEDDDIPQEYKTSEWYEKKKRK